ncbi:AIR synthase-related protein [Latilactobacillus curvatus]|uniref:AIR synthase-related protein n=1 Tax=Latilactobacillus curvatus TaxID=28038 RepID=UPI0020A50553|nr:AIR synthase-related protein [Latilactobacillus curvatus]UTC11863.1 hypothetical protein A4W75_01740 [Latilactobacillus curvatus]
MAIVVGGPIAPSPTNMGIGMVLAVAPEKAAQVLAQLNAEQEQAYRIGSVKPRQENAIELVG